ncbi:MAG: type II CRISPR RNA-guided endonuclease Cas9 [Pirellulales bacterium]|nr:type II CRISPR RNA-guided endonuclease Cas9 [Pirellulales bacterium]
MTGGVSREATDGKYRLGIDMGSGSIGWAAVLENDETPVALLGLGVRRFEAGVLGDIDSGKDESRATARRDARGPRRLAWRRQYRLRKVFRLLQEMDLLPSAADDSHDERHRVLAELDRQIRGRFDGQDSHLAHRQLPYLLRARALDEKLARHEFGRALYHLAQRRGFLSNLKAAKKDEDVGTVKKGIGLLKEEIDRSGARTLGEFFAGLDPEQDHERIRGRWTARGMYQDEFDQVWTAQAKHHQDLDDRHKQRLREAIFFQRPLKSQKGLIGMCELEPQRRRAPAPCLAFQEFRILQRVNDLTVTQPDGEIRALDEQDREKLIAALHAHDKLTFGKLRTLLGMKRSREFGRNYSFNFEEGGEKDLVGNRTAAKMVSALGDRWHELTPDQQNRLVDEILSFESEEPLVGRLVNGWGLSEAQARTVAETPLEPGYAALSRKALARVLPGMRQGKPFATVREEIYRAAQRTDPPVDFLPANHQTAVLRQLRNPAVARALSELRKVVNALIRRYGKPRRVYIELARDLKHARKRRKEMSDQNKRNQAAKDEAKKKILQEMGNDERYCTERNLLKVRLAEESNWECPYTGKHIAMDALVGDRPQFDIEHIIPFSRSLDNSFANKTLCYHEENRKVKGSKTPHEAYHGTGRWDEILARVRRFKGDPRLTARKLALFQTEKLPDPEEFAERQLNDTRYMSRLATAYLGLLYGGQIDEGRTRRIRVSPGRVTHYLRQRWNLNAVLGHPDQKDRADHRHHAIDALVVALTDARQISALSRAAEEAERLYLDGLFPRGGDFEPPWDAFLQDVQQRVDELVVSSRVTRRLNAKLHKDTIFSKPIEVRDEDGNTATTHHVRKPIAALSAKEVEAIVDDKVRQLVQQKLAALGGTPDKVFKERENHPYFRASDGRIIPIHKVRIRTRGKPMFVGAGSKRRYVSPGSNHHMEIVALLDKNGEEKKWEGHVVTTFEAVQRRRRGGPVIRRDHGEGKRFKFSLAGGEHMEMEHEGGKRQIYRVSVISGGQVEFRLHSDARPDTLLRQREHSSGRVRRSIESLRKADARKVAVDPLGNVFPAND